MDGFYFEHTGLIDRHIAYDYYIRKGVRLVKCYVEPFNRLTLYDTLCTASPILEMTPGSQHEVRIEIRDLAGNVTRRSVTVMGSASPQAYQPRHTATPTDHSILVYFDAQRYNRIQYGRFRADFPAGTFYKSLYFDFEPIDSMTFRLHNRSVPLQKPFTVQFDIRHLPPQWQQKAVVARPYPRRDGTVSYGFLGGKVSEGRLTLRTSTPGTFTVALDTIPPSIEKGSWRSGEKLPGRYLRMYIRDGQTGIASFDAYIDGRWVLMEYEYKRRELTLDTQRENIPPGRHTLRVEVTDGVGNRSVFEDVFVR